MLDFKTTQLFNNLFADISVFDNAYQKYFDYWWFFITACIVSFILVPIVGSLAHKYDIVNDTSRGESNKSNKYENNKRRINLNRMAKLGGIPIMLPALAGVLLFFSVNSITIAIALSMLILGTLGFLDDKYNMPATTQFTTHLVCAVLIAVTPIDFTIGNWDLAWATTSFDFMGLAYSIVWPGDIVFILWILVCNSAVKFVGGVDGLIEGTVLMAFAVLFIIAVREGSDFAAVFSVMAFGAATGAFVYHVPPAYIYSASTGKSMYGFLIAVISAIVSTKIATGIIILFLPLLDFIFVIAKRIYILRPKTLRDIISAPLKVMRMPDTNHLHHQFYKLNLSFTQIILIEFSIMLLVSCVAVLTTEAFKFFFIILGGLLFLTLILGLHIIVGVRNGRKKLRIEEESPEKKYSY